MRDRWFEEVRRGLHASAGWMPAEMFYALSSTGRPATSLEELIRHELSGALNMTTDAEGDDSIADLLRTYDDAVKAARDAFDALFEAKGAIGHAGQLRMRLEDAVSALKALLDATQESVGLARYSRGRHQELVDRIDREFPETWRAHAEAAELRARTRDLLGRATDAFGAAPKGRAPAPQPRLPSR
jgi:hypothetical protein